MKKKLIVLTLILVLMWSIPLFTTNNMIIKDFKNKFLTVKDSKKSADLQLTDKEIIYCLTAERYKDEYCDEVIKAMSIILYSNYKFKPSDFKLNNKYRDEFIFKYGKKKFKKMTNAIDNVYGNIITYKNKPAYIPCYYKSSGNTKGSKKYPYIKNAASPWDNTKSNHKVCVSLNGINQLCKKGYNYKEALGWYLEGVKIVNHNSDTKNS